MRALRVLMLIRSWNRGGAERQCAITTRELARRGHDVVAMSIYPGGCFQHLAGETGARMETAGRTRRSDALGPFAKVWKLCREYQPDVIYGFMPLANFLSVIVRMSCNKTACVWGIRASGIDVSVYGRAAVLSTWLERKLIRVPELIICNSEASRKELAPWRTEGVSVIENGIDIDHFSPADSAVRTMVREKFKLDPNSRVVGIVGRLDPVKDHATFLKAAALIAQHAPDTRFVVAGGSQGTAREQLQVQARALNILDRVSWVDATDHVVDVYRTCDVIVSSSVGEGFPNVVAEAMACGVPVVATDVGDSARLVGETGRIVPPRAYEEISAHVLSLLHSDLSRLGAAARERIVQHFSVSTCISKTEEALAYAVAARTAASRKMSERRGFQ